MRWWEQRAWKGVLSSRLVREDVVEVCSRGVDLLDGWGRGRGS